MVTLFNQEYVTKLREYNLVNDARNEGRNEGLQEGLEKGIQAAVFALKRFTADPAAVAQELVKQFELLPETAREKVAQYWDS